MRTVGECLASPPASSAYSRLQGRLSDGDLVVLDGGIATELECIRRDQFDLDRQPWGSWALRHSPTDVRDVHRRYVDAGCDVISTNTWSLIELVDRERSRGRMRCWLDLARISVRLARDAIEEAGGRDRCAVAFALNEAVAHSQAAVLVRALTFVWDEDPPDLVLLETVQRLPDAAILTVVDTLVAAGLPVWVSFKRRRDGFGETHRGCDDAEQFGQGLHELEDRGVGAVLLNCVRPEDLAGAISTLRSRVALPIGVYPNIGRATPESWEPGWRVTPERYAQLAIGWRAEGAQIIGGCCGVTPAHIAAVAASMKRVRGASCSS